MRGRVQTETQFGLQATTNGSKEASRRGLVGWLLLCCLHVLVECIPAAHRSISRETQPIFLIELPWPGHERLRFWVLRQATFRQVQSRAREHENPGGSIQCLHRRNVWSSSLGPHRCLVYPSDKIQAKCGTVPHILELFRTSTTNVLITSSLLAHLASGTCVYL